MDISHRVSDCDTLWSNKGHHPLNPSYTHPPMMVLAGCSGVPSEHLSAYGKCLVTFLKQAIDGITLLVHGLGQTFRVPSQLT